MAFRRNSKNAFEWQSWVQQNRDELIRCGVPLLVFENERNWLYFLNHCYYAATENAEPIIQIDEMDTALAARLCSFLERDDSGHRSAALNRLQYLLKRGPHAER